MLTALALGIGVLTGFGAAAFHLLLEFTDDLWRIAAVSVGLGQWRWIMVLLPVAGSLVALGLIWVFARNDRSHGTSAVIESVALHGGRLPARALLTKVISAAIFIGSGGSAGPEDPSVQLGGVAGSKMAQLFRLSEKRTRTLVASGVAGAVAAAFNAPIAGVFFALEVVVGELSAALFPPVVLAAVAASVVSRWLNGNHPAFQVPTYDLGNALIELPLYALLGGLTALVGVLFIRMLFTVEDAVAKMRLGRISRGISIGLVIALVGLWLPDVIGVGYGTAGQILLGRIDGQGSLALLLGVKLALTALCIGVMGIGGTFAPSLYLGAATGALMGATVHIFFPGTPTPIAAFALVGMGGALTAVVRAPVTAVLLIFEITNDYRIILPIMVCVAVSNLIAVYLFKESVYTERLARHGIRLRSGRDVSIMESVLVRDAMSTRYETLDPGQSIRETLDRMTIKRYHGLPVVRHGELVGIITAGDIARALERGVDADEPVETIATSDLLVAFPDQTLHEAVPLFAVRDVRQVPVVMPGEPRRIIGMLRRTDIVRSYSTGVVRRTEREQQSARPQPAPSGAPGIIEIVIAEGSLLGGRTIHQAMFPSDCILASVHRGDEALLPKPDLLLQPGMRLTFLATPAAVQKLRAFNDGLHPERIDVETSPRYHLVTMAPHMKAVGRMVQELGLPESTLLVAIERNGNTIVPRGKSMIEPGDTITILAEPGQYHAAIQALVG